MSIRLSLLSIVLFCAVSAASADDESVLNVRQFILERVKAGKQQTQVPGPLGKFTITSGNEEGINIEQNSGGKMMMAWKQITKKELYHVSRNMLKDGDVEGHLIVARFAISLGMGEEMDRALERLELEKPQSYSRIERVRVEIADAAAATKKPVPIPAKAVEVATGPAKTEDKNSALAAAGLGAAPAAGATGSRTNHEGRALPPLPAFKKPVLFNTPEADAIMAGLQVFPPTNPWNEDISKKPVHKNSAAIIASIGADKHVHCNQDMNFVLVPPDQPRIDVKLTDYGGESDKGPYPIPDNTPIEGWPVDNPSLDQVQREGDGDRHMIVVDPHNGFLYEFYVGRKTAAGWTAACEATFNLRSNKTRPDGWTSSDAAGLPIFPSIPRFDECERGMVEHALRFTVRRTRKAYIWPATHYASRNDSPDLPAMGQRFRLKASVDISSFPKHAKAIALALKKYGMFVADNGSDWFLSTNPDPRLQGLRSLHSLKGSDFEVIETTPPEQVPGAK